MSGTITVSGLGSGLDYDTWIEKLVAVKQAEIDKVSTTASITETKESILSSLENDYTNLLDSIKQFTDVVSASNVFKQKTASSTDEAVSVTATSTASNQSFSVEVTNLATSTVAKASYTTASYIDSDTKISEVSEGAIDDGYFSIYINGVQNRITVDSDDTLGDVVNQITSTLGSSVTASVNSDGTLSVTAKSSDINLSIGSSSDTSNFVNVMALEGSVDPETDIISFTSSNPLYDTDTSAALTSTEFATSTGGTASVTAGTFYINDVEFTITSTTSTTGTTTGTSIDDLIDEINQSNAGVSAYWDSAAGKLILTSNDTGAVSIDIEAGTSNFTDVMGLTSSTWNPDGSVNSTALVDGSQDLGDNAKFKINGTTITSASNTITSSISGIAGVTLTLNDTTESKATVSVTNNTDALKTAMENLVSSLNTVIADTDTVTATGHSLHGETILNSIRNRIRTLATSSVGGISLANLGITTGAIGTDVDADTNQLTIDSDALETYLESGDLDKLKTLLNGDDTNQGILSQMSAIITKATGTDGYFEIRQESFDKEVDRLNDKIDRMTTSLETYRTQLEAKFSAMDKIISALQNSASIFDSYFNNNNDDDN